MRYSSPVTKIRERLKQDWFRPEFKVYGIAILKIVQIAWGGYFEVFTSWPLDCMAAWPQIKLRSTSIVAAWPQMLDHF